MTVIVQVVKNPINIDSQIIKISLSNTGAQGAPGEGVPAGGTTGQVLAKINSTDYNTQWVNQTGGGGAVDSVNGQTGVVVLDADDISDAATTNKFTTATDIAKLAGIETGADVTDAANVAAAGAVMESDYTPAHSILVQQSGTGSPSTLQIGNNTLVGRLSGGGSNIDDLSASQVRTLLNVADGATAFTNEMAQDAVGGILTNSAEIDFTYNDSTPSITAVLAATAVTAGSYALANITVDAKGRITSAANGFVADVGSVTKTITQIGHGLSVEEAVYHNGVNYLKARADSATTSDVIGIVSEVINADTFVMTTSGYITLTGMTAGQYFLSDVTAGLLTLTPPTTNGYIRKPVLVATSATTGFVQILLGVTIDAASGGVTSVNGQTGTVVLTAADVGAPSGSGTSTGSNSGDITITTTGSSGAATLVGQVLNVPQYAASSLGFNAIGSGNNTTAAMVVGSGGSLSATGTGTIAATTVTGASTITSSSATALAVGQNGATNPAFAIDASTASSVTGVSITSRAAAAGALLQATSSGTNETLTVSSKGNANCIIASPSGAILFQTNITTRVTISGAQMQLAPGTRTSSVAAFFLLTGATGATLTASTEAPLVDINLSATQSHNTGALALQRDYRVRSTTHAFVGASTITNAATFSVDGAPIAGTNATITNSSTYYSAGQAVGAGVTNSYGILLTANTGAANNYCVGYNGTAGEIYRIRTDGQIKFLATNTASGTTGARTINMPSGTVNFAAAAASLVVTNSLCTTSSIVFATVRTNDTTAVIKNVVPAAGSFTINLNAAATAETSVGFFIIN